MEPINENMSLSTVHVFRILGFTPEIFGSIFNVLLIAHESVTDRRCNDGTEARQHKQACLLSLNAKITILWSSDFLRHMRQQVMSFRMTELFRTKLLRYGPSPTMDMLGYTA